MSNQVVSSKIGSGTKYSTGFNDRDFFEQSGLFSKNLQGSPYAGSGMFCDIVNGQLVPPTVSGLNKSFDFVPYQAGKTRSWWRVSSTGLAADSAYQSQELSILSIAENVIRIDAMTNVQTPVDTTLFYASLGIKMIPPTGTAVEYATRFTERDIPVVNINPVWRALSSNVTLRVPPGWIIKILIKTSADIQYGVANTQQSYVQITKLN